MFNQPVVSCIIMSHMPEYSMPKTEPAGARVTNIIEYRNEKIDMLKNDFYINLSPADTAKLLRADNEISIDNIARQLINKKLNK